MLDSPFMRWRYWLIDGPARLTEIGAVWYRAYLTLILILVGPGLLLMALLVLGLWWGFGIRWGW